MTLTHKILLFPVFDFQGSSIEASSTVTDQAQKNPCFLIPLLSIHPSSAFFFMMDWFFKLPLTCWNPSDVTVGSDCQINEFLSPKIAHLSSCMTDFEVFLYTFAVRRYILTRLLSNVIGCDITVHIWRCDQQ